MPESADDQTHRHRWRPDARLARLRLHPRRDHGRGAWRRALADAFFIAFRLPNHFRAIFAEGAFAAAFVRLMPAPWSNPAIDAAAVRRSHCRGADRDQSRPARAGAAVHAEVVGLLAPGLVDDPARFDLAVAFTRITFP